MLKTNLRKDEMSVKYQGAQYLDLLGRPAAVPLHQGAPHGGVQHRLSGDAATTMNVKGGGQRTWYRIGFVLWRGVP